MTAVHGSRECYFCTRLYLIQKYTRYRVLIPKYYGLPGTTRTMLRRRFKNPHVSYEYVVPGVSCRYAAIAEVG